MFEKAGVQIQWQRGQPKHGGTKPAILIEFISNAPLSFHSGALAYALPFEGEHIRIFWDRVMNVTNDWIMTSLLAHVMVHEITHILQGTNYHSREGIMKAHWTDKDLIRLRSEPLSFNRQDIDMILHGWTERRNRMDNAARVNALIRKGQTAMIAAVPARPSVGLTPMAIAPRQ